MDLAGRTVALYGRFQPGVRDQSADGPVDMTAAKDAALQRGEPVLPPGHRLLW